MALVRFDCTLIAHLNLGKTLVGALKYVPNYTAMSCCLIHTATPMKPKKPSPLSAAASAMGKKGSARTLALHGPEHFSKASKARKVFGGGAKG